MITLLSLGVSSYAYDNEADWETLHLYADNIYIRDFRVKELRQAKGLEKLILEKVNAGVSEGDSTVIQKCQFRAVNMDYVRAEVGEYDAFLYYTDSEDENFIRITVKVVKGENNSETKPLETTPPDTNPPETTPPDTNPPETTPPDTNPPETEPLETVPPETNTDTTPVTDPYPPKKIVSYRFAVACCIASAILLVLTAVASVRRLRIILHYSHKKRVGDKKHEK